MLALIAIATMKQRNDGHREGGLNENLFIFFFCVVCPTTENRGGGELPMLEEQVLRLVSRRVS